MAEVKYITPKIQENYCNYNKERRKAAVVSVLLTTIIDAAQ